MAMASTNTSRIISILVKTMKPREKTNNEDNLNPYKEALEEVCVVASTNNM